jgi:cytochrome c biogenesis factor
MCGFSPSEFVIVALLVAVLAGPRLVPFARRAGVLRPRRPAAQPRPEPLRIVIALAAMLLAAFFVLRFGSRLVPLLARLVRGSTW